VEEFMEVKENFLVNIRRENVITMENSLG